MRTDDASTTTANDIGGANDMLSPMEGTDADDLRNSDDVTGDESVGSDLAPEGPGVHLGQVDGAPEDGDPFFQVVE